MEKITFTDIEKLMSSLSQRKKEMDEEIKNLLIKSFTELNQPKIVKDIKQFGIPTKVVVSPDIFDSIQWLHSIIPVFKYDLIDTPGTMLFVFKKDEHYNYDPWEHISVTFRPPHIK